MGMILDYVIKATAQYVEHMPKEQRKAYGQFFTSRQTAQFMAGLFHVPTARTEIALLDPGAGSGILAAALIERLQTVQGLQKIHLTCYENDENIMQLLKSNLAWICQQSVIDIAYKIISENYILSQVLEYNHMMGASAAQDKFDMVIGNPPYMKVSKDAPEAKAMSDICYGAPNLYFLFAGMSLFDTKEQGELVYIIPRSWTSGAYFTKFRQKFLRLGALEHIHLFASRDKVFAQESVLQETMIIKVKKTGEKPQKVHITTTQSSDDFCDKTELDVPYETVVSGKDCYVYLVTSEQEIEALQQVNQWRDILPSIGLKMKTGLTVDFRNREALRNTAENGAVPLFFAHHIQDGKVMFPVGKEHEYLLTKQLGLLQRNTNYLFVKRFTAKEEHRRLQCGIYLAKKNPAYTQISTQNKINFICGLQEFSELSECVVYGLYVLFNSTLYDRYYRILNGSTQVNATEINSMPVPPLSIIESMGKELVKVKDMSEEACDNILRTYM